MRHALILLSLVSWSAGCRPVTTAASPDDPHEAKHTGATAIRGQGQSQTQSQTQGKSEGTSKGNTKGWQALDDQARKQVHEFASAYAAYLARAKTPRQAVSGLVRLYARSGATELGGASAPSGAAARAGDRYYFVSPNGDAAAFVRLGRQPLERGARIIIAAVDAPHIQLKPRPIYDKAGVSLLDTTLYGAPDLPSWLSRPLALYIHLARPGAVDGGLDVVVGERPDDPVLVIPDLLPHLSGKVQANGVIVDSPERMDAIAARTGQALLEALAGHGLDERSLAQAEIALVPAGPPAFVGVDRALLAGHGHGHRALAYAAVRALAAPQTQQAQQARKPGEPEYEYSAMVVVVRSVSTERGSNSALGFVRTAFTRALAVGGGREAGHEIGREAGHEIGREMDVFDTRRAYALAHAWVGARLHGELHQGLILAPQSDDAPPRALRRVIDSLERAGAAYQISGRGGFGPARSLAPLDMDVIDVALPVRGSGAPLELLSTLDLYNTWRAAAGWLAGS